MSVSNASSNGLAAAGKTSERIVDKMTRLASEGKPFYSFEYFPPKTAAGVNNLYARVERMSMLEPLFMDVTWGAGGSTADLTLELSSNMQNYCAPEVMMHLTCTNMPKSAVDSALKQAHDAGIRNILALRGDPPKGEDTWTECDDGFGHAVDLVRYIREQYGDWFGIAVAGYPEGHISAESLEQDIQYLKEKLDAGADFVITQLFYDCDLFIKWVEQCRAAGISAPIIPGIMPIQNYNGFRRMTGFCRTHVPQEILDALEPIKDNDAAVKAYGIQLGEQMCRRLLDAGVQGLHFYTLNLERSVTYILEKLGYVKAQSNIKGLPWLQSKLAHRKSETVRPIFWANRPESYLSRTTTWDEFPNGRWGDSRSPAFGDLTDYHLCSFRTGSVGERRSIWGEELASVTDIYEVFAAYIEGRVPRLPWCENALAPETAPLRQRLIDLNRLGFLTINSQPRANAVPSDDPNIGWGGPGGYIYQKAYLEFFCSPDMLEKLIATVADFPAITYQAINAAGVEKHNIPGDPAKATNAVTWGVFPCKEIIQPTVVDHTTFLVWKDEAFALWDSQWTKIYPAGSDSQKIIAGVRDNYYLVNLVDNDHVRGDIFAVFDAIAGVTTTTSASPDASAE